MYEEAVSGMRPQFTGISQAYEAPETPDLMLNTAEQSADDCAAAVIGYLYNEGVLF